MTGYEGISQTRATPWYPGQLGVRGSDNSLGVRQVSTGIVLYVDAGMATALDANDGTDPLFPKLTVQGAVSSAYLVDNSTIVVGPGTYTESVVIPGTAPDYCTIVGSGANSFWPTITSDGAALDAISLSARGWTIKNLRVVGHTASAGILLLETDSYFGAETVIDNVFFDGAYRGLYGLEFFGSPGMVTVQNCRFSEHRGGAGLNYAVRVTNTGRQDPYECRFLNNYFFENENCIRGSFNVTQFEGNTFAVEGVIPVVTDVLNLTGSTQGHNIVSKNVFAGDYSIAGGYAGNVAHPDMWVGNVAEDVAEATVADNGWTIAPPV